MSGRAAHELARALSRGPGNLDDGWIDLTEVVDGELLDGVMHIMAICLGDFKPFETRMRSSSMTRPKVEQRVEVRQWLPSILAAPTTNGWGEVFRSWTLRWPCEVRHRHLVRVRERLRRAWRAKPSRKAGMASLPGTTSQSTAATCGIRGSCSEALPLQRSASRLARWSSRWRGGGRGRSPASRSPSTTCQTGGSCCPLAWAGRGTAVMRVSARTIRHERCARRSSTSASKSWICAGPDRRSASRASTTG